MDNFLYHYLDDYVLMQNNTNTINVTINGNVVQLYRGENNTWGIIPSLEIDLRFKTFHSHSADGFFRCMLDNNDTSAARLKKLYPDWSETQLHINNTKHSVLYNPGCPLKKISEDEYINEIGSLYNLKVQDKQPGILTPAPSQPVIRHNNFILRNMGYPITFSTDTDKEMFLRGTHDDFVRHN